MSQVAGTADTISTKNLNVGLFFSNARVFVHVYMCADTCARVCIYKRGGWRVTIKLSCLGMLLTFMIQGLSLARSCLGSSEPGG